MSDSLTHVVVGGGTRVTASLTGRELLINLDPTRFRVPASFTSEGMAAAATAYTADLATKWKDTERLTRQNPDWPLLECVLAARTPAAVAAALDPLASALLASAVRGRWGDCVPADQGRGPLSDQMAARATQLFVMLWRHGCVLSPLAESRLGLFFGQRKLPYQSEAFYGNAATIMRHVREHTARTSRAATESMLNRLMLSVHGLEEIGDLSVEVLRPLARAWAESDAELQSALDRVVPGAFEHSVTWINQQVSTCYRWLANVQRAVYAKRPDIAKQIPKSYNIVRPGRAAVKAQLRGSPAKDATFAWISKEFPAYSEWQEPLADYFGTRANVIDMRGQVGSLARLTRALFASGTQAMTPVDACRRPAKTTAVLQSTIEAKKGSDGSRNNYRNHLRLFFDWVITVKARRTDGTVDPALGNPADLLPNYGKNLRRGQTARPKMPGWLLRKAVEVLQGNDYEWARSRKTDHLQVVEDGVVKNVWSPVLAELTLLRFLLPIRGTQARLLGSGEGDSWVWEPGDSDHGTTGAIARGRWIRNVSEWAPHAGQDRAHGFLRRIWDHEQGTWLTGIYISTNKTADKANGWSDPGYEIPWINEEILAIYNRVRRFQQRYNPPREPKSRADLSGENQVVSADVAARLPKMHFLFRDATHKSHADEPVTKGRVNGFWGDLMDELERRCADDPEIPRNADGSAPQLVLSRVKGGFPGKVKYDMHSVRVTGITRLALGGCPMQVLMMLAGHATWIMTLYYVKLSPREVREAMDDAEGRLESLDAADLDEALASVDPEVLRALRVATSDEGLAQLRGTDEALMSSSELGLCPNGGTLCHIGGKAVSGVAGGTNQVYGPVPGLATNCQSCRFLVSGPQYLGGIVARLNALTVQVVTAGDRLRGAEQSRRAVVAERRQMGDAAPAALLRRLRRATASVEAAEAHAEDMSERWQNLYRLFDRCLKALQEVIRRERDETPSNGRHLLVLNGAPSDVQWALRKCHDVELWNRVCFDSEVWDAVDATEAAMRRGMRIDHLLAQSGRPAVFAGLVDEERIAVGNAFARWLKTRVGPAGADDIYEGRRTLAEAGLLDDLDMILPHGATKLAGTSLLPNSMRLLSSSPTG